MQHFYPIRGIFTAPPAGSFQGSPNATITAINTSGGIVKSRTSGTTPCFVQVSASAITATGTTKPYEDLEYQWNFGDPSGTEVFTNPVTGIGLNMNTCQYGPEATYCWRTAGTYTITLTIRGLSSSPGVTPQTFTTAVVSTTFVVSAASVSGGEFWVDSAAAGGGSGTIGSPFNSIAQINSNIASNTVFHLKKGSNFVGATGIVIPSSNNSGIHFDTYGSGASPVININSGSSQCFNLDNSGPSSHDDIVVSGITFTNSGSATQGVLIEVLALSAGGALVSNIYLDNCSLIETLNPATGSITCVFQWTSGVVKTGVMKNTGLWGTSIQSPTTGGGGSGDSTNYFEGGEDWSFVVGGSLGGAHRGDTFDHILYINARSHVHLRYITFTNSPFTGYCVNGNYDGSGGTAIEYTQFWLTSECYFTGTSFGHDYGNEFNDPTLQRYKNVVFQQNACTGITGGGGVIYNIANLESGTFRDNNYWNCTRPFYAPNTNVNGSFSTPQIYRNNCYSTFTLQNAVLAYQGSDGVAPYASVKWMVTDNVTYSTATTAWLFDPIIATFQGDGSIINRNQWFAPNQSGNYLGNTTAGSFAPVSFATWQTDGFDANGKVQNPNWSDPANGKFK